MRKLFILGAVFVFSVAMLMTACKKDKAGEYVDLGLPSGTKWKSVNETGGYNGLYTYDEAMSAFGNKLPTAFQLDELYYSCTWDWQNNGYKVTGPNGNSIILPLAGYRDCNGSVCDVGSWGYYWSSAPEGNENARSFYFCFDVWYAGKVSRCKGCSVRLVQY